MKQCLEFCATVNTTDGNSEQFSQQKKHQIIHRNHSSSVSDSPALSMYTYYVIHHGIVLLLKTCRITFMALLISQMFCRLLQSLEENVANKNVASRHIRRLECGCDYKPEFSLSELCGRVGFSGLSKE